jgi:ABC-type multidrug transport system fused ATPase/permease subunit
LGAIVPTSGDIEISNMTPLDAINRWPGAISYVPQETFIIEGTVRENITLGYKSEQFSDDQVKLSLRKAQLESFIQTLPEGINTQVGEQGTRLSGGQKQRLGIARALVTNPKLLVLDEATSALDAETENLMSLAIQSLKGHVSVVIVAHRLSTVKNADQLIYLDNGAIRAAGTFEELRFQIPEFDNQSKLLGL